MKEELIMGIAQYDAKKIQGMNAERKMYFDGIGIDVNNATSLEMAIHVSGLDFTVQKMPLSFTAQIEKDWMGQKVLVDEHYSIPNQFATVRTDTMQPFGVVSKNYQILQNIEAFDFLDSLVGEAKFETAGLYGGNKAKSFITMSTEPIKILDDEVAPYILFTNSFDGTGAVKVMFTPIRVFCSNCLAVAIKQATNKLSIRHSVTLQSKLESAKYVLLNNTKYLDALKAQAEKLAVTPFSEAAFEALARELFPVNKNDSPKIQVNNEAQLEALLRAYRQDDLQNFNNTAYKAVQAVADFESHKPVLRQHKKADQRNMNAVMLGMPLLNMINERMLAIA